MPETRHDSLVAEASFFLGHAEHTDTHRHERGHLVYPASGVLTLVTASGAWIAPPNRIVWIPGGFDHHHRAHGDADMRIVFMAARMAHHLSATPAVLATTALAREAMLALTDRSRRDPAARNRLRRVIIDELTAAPEQPLHLPEPRDSRLRAVASLVQQDLSSPATLAELGRHVGAGERTLSRLFHEETGMGFRQWRTQLRVHRALLMLAEGETVMDVSVACGWSNPSMFIEAFTLLVGQTPGSYQRSL